MKKLDPEAKFRAEMRMSSKDYRAIDAARGFLLELPAGYREDEVLAYLGRDPESLSEKRSGRRAWKALLVEDVPTIIEVEIGTTTAVVHAHANKSISRLGQAVVHRAALHMLGLVGDVTAFEKAHAKLTKPRRGLRISMIPSVYDALCWAIVGQQINLRFACTLRRRLIAAAGQPIEAMRVHPTPAAVAALDSDVLTSQQFSRSKARYLRDVAQAIVLGKLDIENLRNQTAEAAESALLAQRGVGVWTARYVLLRTGFPDSAPVGDSAIATALERLHGLPERPDAAGTEELMARYAPYRSLASMHLWASLA